MTDTLVRQGYTDIHVVPDSSVIDTAYFDEDTERLFIDLRSGTRVGYRDFSKFAWQGFKRYGSAGSYWNRYIKGAYTGINGDVELFDRNVYPSSPSVDEQGAVVYSQAANAFTAFKSQPSVLTNKYHVLVEVAATDFASAVENVGSGEVKSVTRL